MSCFSRNEEGRTVASLLTACVFEKKDALVLCYVDDLVIVKIKHEVPVSYEEEPYTAVSRK